MGKNGRSRSFFEVTDLETEIASGKLITRGDFVQKDIEKYPLEVFMHCYRDLRLSSAQLKEIDKDLYYALRRKKSMDEAIPPFLDRFLDLYGDLEIGRSKLKNIDRRLYYRLSKEGTLDRAIPKKLSTSGKQNENIYGDDLVAYFREKYEGMDLSRSELSLIDNPLYQKLHRTGLISEAIPTVKQQGGKRLYEDDPLGDFKEIYDGRVINRSRLRRERPKLHKMLTEKGLLDEAIPETKEKYVINLKEYMEDEHLV